MIHGGKKWSTLTAAVLLALGSFALPQTAWAATALSGDGTASNTENARALHTSSTAVGDNTQADANGTAVGSGAQADANGTAVGSGTQADANGTAVGSGAQAGANGTAVGEGAQAGDNGIAVGAGAQAITNSVALGTGSEATEANSISVGGAAFGTRTITNVKAGDSANDAAIWDQIAKTGQTVSFLTEISGEGAEITETKHNQLVANDGTVLATFGRMASVSDDDYGFVSGADLYHETRDGISSANYISESNTTGENLSLLDAALANAVALEGSDTISITDGKISVKNMAWNEGKGSLSIGIDNNIGTGGYASGGNNNYVIGASNNIATRWYASGGNNNYVIGASNTIGGDWAVSGGSNNYVTGSSNEIGNGGYGGSNNYVTGSIMSV